jgi:O-antigen/teichoic acid export membrane protein
MPTRQIATSTLWQLASQITMAALSILTVKFVAMGLTKELAGNYNSAYGYLQLFGILADFGLYAIAVREVSRTDRKEEVLGALILLRSIVLIASLGVALLFVWLMPMWQGTPLPLSITIAALVPFFTLLAGIIRTIFQVHYRMHYVFIAEVTQRIITVSLIGLFIVLGVRGSNDLQILHMFLFVGGIGAFVLFLLSLVYANRLVHIRIHFDPVLLKDLAMKAVPYGVAFLCMALYRQFDVTLIALLRDDFELQNAYYGFVVRMADMGFLIPTFLLNSVLPTLSERDARGEDTRQLLGKTLLTILTLGSIAALFAFFWPRPLIQLLTTESYLSTAHRPGSDTALFLLSIPLLLNGVILFSFYVLLTRLIWKRLVGTLLAAGIISVALNLWLIPLYGFVGAASTSIVVHILLALLLFPQGLSVLPVSLPRGGVIRWCLFSVLLGILLWMMAPYLTSEVRTILGLIGATVGMFVIAFLTQMHRVLAGK